MKKLFCFISKMPSFTQKKFYLLIYSSVPLFLIGTIYSQKDNLDEVIKNKIILCTGPSLGRKQMLQETLKHDCKFIQYKKIFLVTNDNNNLNFVFKQLSPECSFIPIQGQQLDCLNCIITNLRLVANDPSIEDDDIIIFKHESVYINDIYLVKKAIEKIVCENYDCVMKYWSGHEHYGPYFCTDCFYLKVSAARLIIKNQPLLITPPAKGYIICELYFTHHLVNQLKKIYKIDFYHTGYRDNELGFYHIAKHEKESYWYWDKSNYFSLY